MEKKEKRLAKRKLLKLINMLSYKEKKKMLEETSAKKVGTKWVSMGKKTWIIKNIPNKDRFYEEGLLVKPIEKNISEISVEEGQ